MAPLWLHSALEVLYQGVTVNQDSTNHVQIPCCNKDLQISLVILSEFSYFQHSPCYDYVNFQIIFLENRKN